LGIRWQLRLKWWRESMCFRIWRDKIASLLIIHGREDIKTLPQTILKIIKIPTMVEQVKVSARNEER
jgi:hypothetical protein